MILEMPIFTLQLKPFYCPFICINGASSRDYGCFRSSNSHTQPSSGARCLIFGRTLRLLMYANSEGAGETAQARLSLRWSPM